MGDYDVVVVGASTAGLYAAARLAHAGKRVAVFEQQVALAPARRTLIVTPRLQEVLGAMPGTSVLHMISVMRVQTPNASVDIELLSPDLIVERTRLIRHLAQQATDAGAELHFGLRFQTLQPHRNGVSLCLNGHQERAVTVTAEAVIGADGVFSQVASAAGLGRPACVPILQAEVALPPGWDPEMTQVWFDANDTRFFYWLIPEAEDRGVVGLVGDDRRTTHYLLQRFLQRHHLAPLAYQGAQVAMHHPGLRPWGHVGKAPVFLVGDAAGQVKVTTVGGTVTGFWGAQAAVSSLLGGTSYARELGPLKRELDVHWLLRRLLERLDNAGYDTLVRNISPAVRAFLSQRNRDEMARGVWRLLLLQPCFIPLGLSLLLRRRHTPTHLASDRMTQAPETE